MSVETPIEEFIKNNTQVKPKDLLSNCYMMIEDYNTKHYGGEYNANYFLSLSNSKGEKLDQRFKLSITGLQNLMMIIQNNKLKMFSDVYLLMLEEIAKYNKGADIHYYLKVILDQPGKNPSIPKVKKKIPSCKECNTMLLRYGFRWKIQRDDLLEKTCPFCKKPLTIENRTRKLISIKLNFSEESCNVGDTRAQIGILYHDQEIKSTINPKGIFHYLQNYQNNFKDLSIGPLNLKFRNGRPLYINEVVPGDIISPLEWRPAILFPEDFLAL